MGNREEEVVVEEGEGEWKEGIQVPETCLD